MKINFDSLLEKAERLTAKDMPRLLKRKMTTEEKRVLATAFIVMAQVLDHARHEAT